MSLNLTALYEESSNVCGVVQALIEGAPGQSGKERMMAIYKERCAPAFREQVMEHPPLVSGFLRAAAPAYGHPAIAARRPQPSAGTGPTAPVRPVGTAATTITRGGKLADDRGRGTA